MNRTRERAAFLRAELERHNKLYYEHSRPVISDREYDRLFRELEELERKHPELAEPDSPTRRVGSRSDEPAAESRERREVRHAIPMLSLANTYSPEELIDFERQVLEAVSNPEYVVEPKIDGVAVALSYDNGALIRAATRGDGIVGEDVTPNVRTIAELPQDIQGDEGFARGTLELRGEIYLSKRRFADIVEEMIEAGETPFANPRNTAAGTLKLLDPSEVRRRKLGIFIHSIADRREGHDRMLAGLRELGFPTPPDVEVYQSIEEIRDRLPEFERRRHQYPFETDGLVIKLNRPEQRQELGERSRTPRWAIAYKFAPEIAETTLLAIDLQVGRTGVVTPVAKFEPVRISGTTVSSATLHNEDEIRRLGLRVGDRIEVQKAGEIIPQVLGVKPSKKRGPEFRMPANCPVCGRSIVRPEGEARWRCVNPACPATATARVIHFASRRAMEIDGLGASTAELLLSHGLVRDPADLYALRMEQLKALPRLAEKSAANLLGSIERSKERPLERLLFALGIPGVGERTAADLATEFRSLDAVSNASEDRLLDVPEIGARLAGRIRAYFALDSTKELISRLKAADLRAAIAAEKKKVSVDSPLAGKKVVVTGTVEGLDRRGVEEALRRLGATPGSSVSRQTDLVIVGTSPGSKAAKARELGVAIMDAEQFLKML